MTVSNNEKPHWFFYLGWVVLNVIAVVTAWHIAWALISQITKIIGGTIQVGGQSRITEDFLFVCVLFPIIGLLTGIFQYTLLRRYLPHMAWWIAATLLGWLIPFVTGYFIIAILAQKNDTFSIMLGMFLIGTTMVVPQWWMLRQRVTLCVLVDSRPWIWLVYDRIIESRNFRTFSSSVGYRVDARHCDRRCLLAASGLVTEA